MNITVVTYYVELHEKTKNQLKNLFPFIADIDPFSLINSLFASSKLIYPHCQRVLLTNNETKIPGKLAVDLVQKYSLDIEHLTLSRTEAQLRYLQSYQGSNFLLFLDYDILLQHRLDEIADYLFDIAVTVREHEMPINGGVLIFHPQSLEKGRQFMQELIDEMRKLPPYFHLWYGSQIALKQKIPFHFAQQLQLIEVESYKILVLPSLLYNYSSPSPEMSGDYPDKKILHFKGARKIYQLPYFHNLNNPP